MSPGGGPLLDGRALIAAADERFGSAQRVQPSPDGWETDVHLYITLHDGDTSVSFQTNEHALRETVAWYRSLLPVDSPRIIACDEGWNGHVDLVPGITAEDVADRWVDHTIDGWNTGDPDLGRRRPPLTDDDAATSPGTSTVQVRR